LGVGGKGRFFRFFTMGKRPKRGYFNRSVWGKLPLSLKKPKEPNKPNKPKEPTFKGVGVFLGEILKNLPSPVKKPTHKKETKNGRSKRYLPLGPRPEMPGVRETGH
jgi:hypothetical protein